MKPALKKRITVGMLVSGITDSFIELICKGAMKEAALADVNLIVVPGKYLDRDLTDNRELQYEYQYNTIFSYVKRENVDALLVVADCISCFTTQDHMEQMLAKYAGVPCVLIASKMGNYTNITFDNTSGIREALHYLYHWVGCRRFGMIGGPDSNTDACERKHTFFSYLEAHDIHTSDISYLEGNLTKLSPAEYSDFLNAHPDMEAVFCVNDDTALGLCEEMIRRHIIPGQDISVIGYDDTLAAAKAYPPLASVRADSVGLGAAALRTVLKKLSGENVSNVVLPTNFVLRDSVCTAQDRRARHKLNSFSTFFDEVFYRSKYDISLQQQEELNKAFLEISSLFQRLFSSNCWDQELSLILRTQIDFLLRMPIFQYADVDNFLSYLRSLSITLCPADRPIETQYKMQELLSYTCMRLVQSMDHRQGIIEQRETGENYFLKLFVRDMLQYEHGHDQSYTTVLSNLDWLSIHNAFLFTFEKPVTHLYDDTFTPPATLYLKAILLDGSVRSVSAAKQPIESETLFEVIGKFCDKRYSMVLLPLFFNELLYGILLCDLSDALFENGEFLVSQMSSSVKMIDLLKSNEQIQLQLEESLAALRENNVVLDTLSKSDMLTGIYNRRGFMAAAEVLLEKSKNTGCALLILYLDMNNLKIINDLYGHDEGDYTLKTISSILTEQMRGKGIVGRIGGDEFACALVNKDHLSGADVLNEIYESFHAFNADSEKPYNITVSGGSYLLPVQSRCSLAEALSEADERLYEVKKLRTKDVIKKLSK